jgi:shikimate kinase
VSEGKSSGIARKRSNGNAGKCASWAGLARGAAFTLSGRQGHPRGRGPNVVLVGMMGAGKSTVAKLVAARAGWPAWDTDELVERATGMSVAEVFASSGEAEFRRQESAAVAYMGEIPGPYVLSVGGGAVLSQENREALGRLGTLVWLRARPGTLAARVGTGEGRPLLAGQADGEGRGAEVEARLAELAAERGGLYRDLADLVVDVDELSPEEVADFVCGALDALGWSSSGRAPGN